MMMMMRTYFCLDINFEVHVVSMRAIECITGKRLSPTYQLKKLLNFRTYSEKRSPSEVLISRRFAFDCFQQVCVTLGHCLQRPIEASLMDKQRGESEHQ